MRPYRHRKACQLAAFSFQTVCPCNSTHPRVLDFRAWDAVLGAALASVSASQPELLRALPKELLLAWV
jgi:hypothetical protein